MAINNILKIIIIAFSFGDKIWHGASGWRPWEARVIERLPYFFG
jgi:hypothetical protein